jgi:hypothetical protein
MSKDKYTWEEGDLVVQPPGKDAKKEEPKAKAPPAKPAPRPGKRP